MFYALPSNITMAMDGSSGSFSAGLNASISSISLSSSHQGSSRGIMGYSNSNYNCLNSSSSTHSCSSTYDGSEASLSIASSGTGSGSGSGNINGRPLRTRKSKGQLITPDYTTSIYDSVRDSVADILNSSTKFQLRTSRNKGVVLTCGEDTDTAAKEGFGLTIVPLKVTTGKPVTCVDNPLVHALAKYASSQEFYEDQDLPDIIVGLCCNNWGHYHGRNAFIEALLEIMGPEQSHKLSIHSALYAVDFNTKALEKILPFAEDDVADEETATRILHAEGYQETARKYNIGLDTIEKNDYRFEGLSKQDFVEILSETTIQIVQQALDSDEYRPRVLDLITEMIRERQRIQENLSNKKFRRARSINGIDAAAKQLGSILQNFVDEDSSLFWEPSMFVSRRVPGWKNFVEAASDDGCEGAAIFRLFCHSVDVLAGCVARSGTTVGRANHELAERLVATILDKDNRLLEYAFNQVYDLMPSTNDNEKLYIYRKIDDLHLFSTMSCAVAEFGGKL